MEGLTNHPWRMGMRAAEAPAANACTHWKR
jgi:hypothetical protein